MLLVTLWLLLVETRVGRDMMLLLDMGLDMGLDMVEMSIWAMLATLARRTGAWPLVPLLDGGREVFICGGSLLGKMRRRVYFLGCLELVLSCPVLSCVQLS